MSKPLDRKSEEKLHFYFRFFGYNLGMLRETLELPSFWILSLRISAVVLVRYFIFAGAFYLLFYVIKKKAWANKKIDHNNAPRKVVRNEILWSIVTSAIFGTMGAAVILLWKSGHTQVYERIEDYGWGYFLFSLFALAFMHDTYFYWMHRLAHHPKLFNFVHKVHHDSMNPTPWATFSFHWSEALLEACVLPILVFTIPIHLLALLTLLLFMTVTGVINHLGYEFYPRGLARHPIFKFFVSATHHHIHHQYFRCNYGLYFSFWDRWMGTENPKYPDIYEAVHQGLGIKGAKKVAAKVSASQTSSLNAPMPQPPANP